MPSSGPSPFPPRALPALPGVDPQVPAVTITSNRPDPGVDPPVSIPSAAVQDISGDISDIATQRVNEQAFFEYAYNTLSSTDGIPDTPIIAQVIAATAKEEGAKAVDSEWTSFRSKPRAELEAVLNEACTEPEPLEVPSHVRAESPDGSQYSDIADSMRGPYYQPIVRYPPTPEGLRGAKARPSRPLPPEANARIKPYLDYPAAGAASLVDVVEDRSVQRSSANDVLFCVRTKVFNEDSGQNVTTPSIDTIAQFDLGGAMNIVDRGVALSLGCRLIDVPRTVFTGVGGDTGYTQRCRIYLHLEGLAYHCPDVRRNKKGESLFIGVDCFVDDNPVFPILIGGNTMQNFGMVNTREYGRTGEVINRYLHIERVPGWAHKLRVDCAPPYLWKKLRNRRDYNPVIASVQMVTNDITSASKPVALLWAEADAAMIKKPRAEPEYSKPKSRAVKDAETKQTLPQPRQPSSPTVRST